METILDKIIQQKQKEIQTLRKIPVEKVARKKRSLVEKFKTANEVLVIAEFKRASPSKGMINDGIEPEQQAAIYERSGASAISVLTDETFFKGSYSDLKAVRAEVDLPILCKDFIIDTCQIDHAAANGADIILLIVAAMNEDQLIKLFQYAQGLNLEVLVEVHNQEEATIAINTGAKLIGVNNRDLKTFNVSLEVTESLAGIIKNSGAFLISESGIHTKEDVDRVRDAGANGILVGEALMKSKETKQTLEEFRRPLIKEVNK